MAYIPSNAFAAFIDQPGLKVQVNGGLAAISGVTTSIAARVVTPAANTTTYIYLDTVGGTITSNTSGFPTSNAYSIAIAVTGTTQILVLTDMRPDVPGVGGGTTTNYADEEVPSGSINGSNVTFTLAFAPSPAKSLLLVQNGIILEQGIGNDYTLAGSTITMAVAPNNGAVLLAWYRR